MKKLLSVVLAAIMTVSVMVAAAIPALAVESPTATTAKDINVTTQVNSVVNTKDVIYSTAQSNPYAVTFKYTGEGRLLGWEENMQALGFIKGVDYDYTAVQNQDGTFTVTFISDRAKAAYDNGDVIINALVAFDSTTKAPTTNKNESPKAPNTGIATSVIAGSIAVAGAGIAVLSATKKKDAE